MLELSATMISSTISRGTAASTPPIAAASSSVGMTSAIARVHHRQRLQRKPQLAQAGDGSSLNSALRNA